jgi:hypothetical protein
MRIAVNRYTSGIDETSEDNIRISHHRVYSVSTKKADSISIMHVQFVAMNISFSIIESVSFCTFKMYTIDEIYIFSLFFQNPALIDQFVNYGSDQPMDILRSGLCRDQYSQLKAAILAAKDHGMDNTSGIL